MASVSRSSILTTLVAVILLLTLPRAIRNFIQTGPYLFSEQFFADMLARLSGPGRLRFILQPTVAIFLGTRDGIKDARAHLPPFLWGLIFHSEHRQGFLRSATASLRDLVMIAILLDMVSQLLIFRNIHPGAALLLGPVLIGTPYAAARAFANRITRRRTAPPPAVRAS
jgi:hypothetical protein